MELPGGGRPASLHRLGAEGKALLPGHRLPLWTVQSLATAEPEWNVA